MIKGSVTLVTGGASGLGRATAEHLVQNGSLVVINDLQSSDGEDIAKQLGEDKCTFIPGDVSSETDVQKIIKAIEDRYGRLDNIVNCAGVVIAQKTYESKTTTPHDLDAFSYVLNVNTIGTFNVIRLAVRLMSKNKPNSDGQCGVIVNTASVAAFEGQIGNVAYAASKAAVVGMTLPLAREMAAYGIRVCTIAPGVFETAMTSLMPPHIWSSLMKTAVFPRRAGRPPEFAMLVQHIIENPMLNGEVIRLDAGIRFQGGKL